MITLIWAMLRSMWRGSATAAGVALMIFAVAAGADSLAVVDPLPPGPYAVGCSNVEQDFSRVLPGETAKNYWEAFPMDPARAM